ncbi:uncharacterized protein DS421_13g409250 [Arachis hypogaea]|nr:uncharacterized protein DS421_13g409250 [Arachis hypogaea]
MSILSAMRSRVGYYAKSNTKIRLASHRSVSRCATPEKISSHDIIISTKSAVSLTENAVSF